MSDFDDIVEAEKDNRTRIAIYKRIEDGFSAFQVIDVKLTDASSYATSRQGTILIPVDDVSDDFEPRNIFTLTTPESGHISGRYLLGPEDTMQVGLEYNPHVQSKYREIRQKHSEQYEKTYADEEDLTF